MIKIKVASKSCAAFQCRFYIMLNKKFKGEPHELKIKTVTLFCFSLSIDGVTLNKTFATGRHGLKMTYI